MGFLSFFKKAYYAIIGAFKVKPSPRIKEPESKPTPSIINPDDDGAFCVAFIEGHSWRDEGARSYNKKSEKSFNDKVQRYVFKNYSGKIRLVTFDRPDYMSYGSAVEWLAKECDNINVDLAIELHFNAAGVKTARGNHKRIIKGDHESLSYAKLFNRTYLAMFPFATFRRIYEGVKGVCGMGRRDAGYWFCYHMEKRGIASMLDEPFFADFRNEESEPFMEGDGYKKLGDYWVKCLELLEEELNL